MSTALLFILAACKIRLVCVPDNGGASGRKPDKASFFYKKIWREPLLLAPSKLFIDSLTLKLSGMFHAVYPFLYNNYYSSF